MKGWQYLVVPALFASAVLVLANWDTWVALVHTHQKSIVERSLVLFVACPLAALGFAAWRQRWFRG